MKVKTMINDEVGHIEDYIAVPAFKSTNCRISLGNTFHPDLTLVENDAWVDQFEGFTSSAQNTQPRSIWNMAPSKFSGAKYGVMSQKALKLVEPRNQNFATQASFSINFIQTDLPPGSGLAYIVLGQPVLTGTSPSRYWSYTTSDNPWVIWDPYTKKISVGTNATIRTSSLPFSVANGRHVLTVQFQLMYNDAEDIVLRRVVANIDGIEEKILDWAYLYNDSLQLISKGTVFSNPYHIFISNASLTWSGWGIYSMHWWVG